VLRAQATQRTGSLQRSVLCIDDDPDSLDLIETILGHAGAYKLLKAATGAAGLELALEVAPDLILLDFDLPDAHGLDILKRLREDPRTGSIPVIGISGTSHPTPRYIRGTGIDGFVRKPLDDIPAFMAAVQRELGG